MFIPQSLFVILLFLISSKQFLQSEITLFTNLLEYRSPLTVEDTSPEPLWLPKAVDGMEPWIHRCFPTHNGATSP